MAVGKDSSLLQLPDSDEIKIRVDQDHSNLVKFDFPQDKTYRTVINYLREIQETAGNLVVERFGECSNIIY